MTETEQRELDAWIANLMEPKPVPMPLRMERGARDEEYNFAEIPSALGWWKCETGSDEGDGETLCDWQLRFKITSADDWETKGAALEVLKKCLIRLAEMDANMEQSFLIPECLFEISHSRTASSGTFQAETLELAICLFAKKLFSN